MLFNRIYYNLKPIIPRRLQIFLRRKIARYKLKKYADIWPIDPRSGKSPKGWECWPENRKFAFLLCHDVDTQRGHNKCLKLAKIEKNLGFCSFFNFVPKRYKNSDNLHQEIRKLGCGIGVHGLKHDGKLFTSYKIFKQRTAEINAYLKKWNTKGFTSPSMHSNFQWLHELNITYSTSTFDTDPFEPQPNAVRTIFPIWQQKIGSSQGYFELPYTLPQDHLLFIILKEKNIDIWKMKLDWIVRNKGMALVNTHADYMNFTCEESNLEEYPISRYVEFLQYVRDKYACQYWNTLPEDVVRFWENTILNKS